LRTQPPVLGENTREILAAAGYTADEIDGLVDRHVIIAAASKAPELAR
jgi:crotonobetainyl-CoA:carnitine CoA-transferase CaiB-like acyl-CoA transferase